MINKNFSCKYVSHWIRANIGVVRKRAVSSGGMKLDYTVVKKFFCYRYLKSLNIVFSNNICWTRMYLYSFPFFLFFLLTLYHRTFFKSGSRSNCKIPVNVLIIVEADQFKVLQSCVWPRCVLFKHEVMWSEIALIWGYGFIPFSIEPKLSSTFFWFCALTTLFLNSSVFFSEA